MKTSQVLAVLHLLPAEENNDRIHPIWMDCRRLDMNKMGAGISIFPERVENFLHNELGMTKTSTRWVPRHLTYAQKRNTSGENLTAGFFECLLI